MRIVFGILIMVVGLMVGIYVSGHLWNDAATTLIDAINSGRLDPAVIGDATFHLILSLVAGYILIAIFNGLGHTVMGTEE